MVGVAVIPISVIVYYILIAISWLLLYCQCPMTAISFCVLGVCPSSNPDAHRHACFGECVKRNSRIQNCESLPAMCELRESNPSFNTYTHERCTSIAASLLARPNAAFEIPNLGKVARTGEFGTLQSLRACKLRAESLPMLRGVEESRFTV